MIMSSKYRNSSVKRVVELDTAYTTQAGSTGARRFLGSGSARSSRAGRIS
jgi:hypothetical protein